jgi:hypothetical protein
MRLHRLAFVALIAACSGAPPVLAPIDDQVVAVGGELRLTLSASTQDGSRIAWDYTSDMPAARERAQLTERPDGTGVFVLRPLASDVGPWVFTFTASSSGGSETLTVGIEVKPAIGESTRPLFRSPTGAGTMLDVATQACATIAIEVDDADSTEVRIDLEEPRPANAEITARDKKKATLRFCPDANQKVSEDRVPLRIFADDGDNPKEYVNYTVVLKKPADAGCAGAAPVITHAPADEETVLALELSVDVSDDKGLKSAPLVFFGESKFDAAADLGRLVQEGKVRQGESVLASGSATRGSYRAEIPNPAAARPIGSAVTLWYVVVATDNDDANGNCDHTTTSPVYSMTVTNPGTQGQLAACEPCTHDIQCGGAADSCVRMGTSGEGFCTRGCAASTCGAGFTCQDVRSVNDVASKQCVPVSGSCVAGLASCSDDPREEDDVRDDARVLSPGVHDLVSCPSHGSFSDEDWFELQLGSASKVELSLEGTRASDLDLDLFDVAGARLATSQGPESEEGITRSLPAGRYFVRARAQTILGAAAVERNGYRLTYVTGRACEDDAFEDDDDLDQARPQPILWGYAQRGTICGGDDDYFEVQLAEGENLIVDLLFTQSRPTENLDLHFLDAEGNDLTPCSEADPSTCSPFQGQGAQSDEHYEFYVDESMDCVGLCTFYVVVHGWNGSENRYDLVFGLED